jgi:hypothetical protein
MMTQMTPRINYTGVGEFRKTRHPRNIECNEVLEIYFFRGKEHAIFRNLGPAKPRSREHAIFGNLEPAKPRSREHAIFGNLEPAKPRSREHAIFRNLEPAKPRSHVRAEVWNLAPAESQISEDGKFGSLPEVCFGSRERGIHEPVGSKVKVVVPKSPGLECELVAGL